MKKDTTEAKLNALFGDMFAKKVEEVKTRTTGRVVGVTEEEIQDHRAAQGILYFLQAPELFSSKTCGHCNSQFFVSRRDVKFCSYGCIKLELRKQGFEWRKGNDIEALVNDPQVYAGNEPIWINSRQLQSIREMVLSLPEDLTHKSPELPSYDQIVTSDQERISSSNPNGGSSSPSPRTTSTTTKPTFTIKMS